jgi:hypothetical protein
MVIVAITSAYSHQGDIQGVLMKFIFGKRIGFFGYVNNPHPSVINKARRKNNESFGYGKQ